MPGKHPEVQHGRITEGKRDTVKGATVRQREGLEGFTRGLKRQARGAQTCSRNFRGLHSEMTGTTGLDLYGMGETGWKLGGQV